MALILVCGGGFFGMYLAEHLSKKGHRVILAEKEADFMQRASLVNQARVHNGYHYPRSMLTALRSRVSFPRFGEEFKECIDAEFDKYYMVGRVLGNVTAKQFEKFCHRIGAPCEPAPSRITKLTNPSLVEAVYQTAEYAFDAGKIKSLMTERLNLARVEVRLRTKLVAIEPDKNGRINAQLETDSTFFESIPALDHVFNCTYSMINAINVNSKLEIIPLKHEMAELALVDVPSELSGSGVTIMCGPFFSFMPYPAGGCHSFSHVRYTPHYDWSDNNSRSYIDAHAHFERTAKRSDWHSMWRDAMRYLPVLEGMKYRDSIWEVKTILPRSESDDSRPILFRPNHGFKGNHVIMGGKIDNVYDAINEIDRLSLVG